jgi:protein-S-isoprenylcysteine O-methyltransferase Ste14
MKAAIRVPHVMRIPPPLLFVATFFAGLGLQRLAPLTVHSSSVERAGHLIGLGLVICGALLALACLGMFLAARTTLKPFGAASRLITRGPYRFTRNPMYLSLTLVYLGLVGMLVQPWPLLLLPLPVAILNMIVIPFEEARLREVFGGVFQEYCANVRRWL